VSHSLDLVIERVAAGAKGSHGFVVLVEDRPQMGFPLIRGHGVLSSA
jgi:hypothetical protein